VLRSGVGARTKKKGKVDVHRKLKLVIVERVWNRRCLCGPVICAKQNLLEQAGKEGAESTMRLQGEQEQKTASGSPTLAANAERGAGRQRVLRGVAERKRGEKKEGEVAYSTLGAHCPQNQRSPPW